MSRFPGWRSLCTDKLYWWVELDLFSLECSAVSSSELFSAYGFSMALCSPSFNVQDCVPVLLENYHGVSCTGSCWLLVGACFFWGDLLCINIPGIIDISINWKAHSHLCHQISEWVSNELNSSRSKVLIYCKVHWTWSQWMLL